MQWRRTLTALVLLVIAAALAAGNVWFAAVRSTIPMQLDSVVAGKEVRHEKHPPKDDVCLLALGEQGTIHVDRAVFDMFEKGDRIQKEPWSGKLLVNRQAATLQWSADFWGMAWAMPLAWSLMVALSAQTCRDMH